jgi:hypothetical protein
MRPRRFSSRCLAGTAVLLLVCGGGACRSPQSPTAEATGMTVAWARLYADGTAADFDLTAVAREQLETAVRQLVAGAGGVLRLAVTAERVQQYREGGRGVELAFAAAETLQYAGGSRVIVPSRLFVLWGGDLVAESGESLVVLYGYPEYSAGPLKVKAGRTEFLEVLAGLPRRGTEARD